MINIKLLPVGTPITNDPQIARLLEIPVSYVKSLKSTANVYTTHIAKLEIIGLPSNARNNIMQEKYGVNDFDSPISM